MQDEIEQAAYEYTKAVDDGEKVIVGVNRYVERRPRGRPRCSRSTRPSQAAPDRAGAARPRAERDQAAVDAALADVARRGPGHARTCCVPMKEALRRRATLGEVSDVLRDEFGVYQPTR